MQACVSSCEPGTIVIRLVEINEDNENEELAGGDGEVEHGERAVRKVQDPNLPTAEEIALHIFLTGVGAFIVFVVEDWSFRTQEGRNYRRYQRCILTSASQVMMANQEEPLRCLQAGTGRRG